MLKQTDQQSAEHINKQERKDKHYDPEISRLSLSFSNYGTSPYWGKIQYCSKRDKGIHYTSRILKQLRHTLPKTQPTHDGQEKRKEIWYRTLYEINKQVEMQQSSVSNNVLHGLGR